MRFPLALICLAIVGKACHPSITRLITKLKDLECKMDQSSTFDLTKGMAQKLELLDVEFYKHHLVDLIDEEDEAALAKPSTGNS